MEFLKEKLKLHVHIHGCMIFIQDGHRVPEEKQDLCAGMAREQPRSQSSQDPVDYYKG